MHLVHYSNSNCSVLSSQRPPPHDIMRLSNLKYKEQNSGKWEGHFFFHKLSSSLTRRKEIENFILKLNKDAMNREVFCEEVTA